MSTDRELAEAFRFMQSQPVLRFAVVAAEEKKANVNNNNAPQEAVIDIDVGNLLPVIQNLIETFGPRFAGRGWRGGT